MNLAEYQTKMLALEAKSGRCFEKEMKRSRLAIAWRRLYWRTVEEMSSVQTEREEHLRDLEVERRINAARGK